MKRLLLAMLLVPSLALAAEEKTAAPSSGDPMANWVPPKVTNASKDKQEIQALLHAMDAAGRTGDLDAAAALVDFPVMMMTDDSKGEAMGEPWSRDRWTEVMKPFYDKPMKDVKITHKPTIFLLSDSLASVDDVSTMTMGGKTVTSRSSSLLVRRDGKWRVKTMAEGGWGDMMAKSQQGTASGAQTPSSERTGSGAAGSASQGTGSATEAPGSQGTGSGAQPMPPPASGGAVETPATPGTGSGAQVPPERTTK
ncbi:MAG TPA: hypothetical protein VF912_05745 [Anaeromyxobacter sp.]